MCIVFLALLSVASDNFFQDYPFFIKTKSLKEISKSYKKTVNNNMSNDLIERKYKQKTNKKKVSLDILGFLTF